MIITTNFDRLLEEALATVNVVPDVISTDDAMDAVPPYVHSKLTIVKLHGDYRDSRIKNTPAELASYSDRMNRLLDRIFDDFGLVVCGWSAEWDTALRQALQRTGRRRFAALWLARDAPGSGAREVVAHLGAQVIAISDADSYFGTLQDKVTALQDLYRAKPTTTALVIATAKRYIPDPLARIRLHDLVQEEATAVSQLVGSMPMNGRIAITRETFQARVHELERGTDRLTALLATIAYFDEGGNAELLSLAITRIGNWIQGNGHTEYLHLQRYPALVCLYSAGISAMAARHFNHLSTLLLRPKLQNVHRQRQETVIDALQPETVFEGGSFTRIGWSERQGAYYPEHTYLFETLRAGLKDLIPDESIYEQMFDRFEVFLSLVYLDQTTTADKSGHILPGRYIGKHYAPLSSRSPQEVEDLFDYFRGLASTGGDANPSNAGFFGGSAERLAQVIDLQIERSKLIGARHRP